MLEEYPGHGVAAFCVRDIPPALTSEDGRRFDFGVEYRPLFDNRAHSEVHSYVAGVRLKDEQRKPPRLIRKKFRDLLRQKIEILDLKEDEGGSRPLS